MNRLTISLVAFQEEFPTLAATLDSVLQSTVDLKLYLIDNSPSDVLKTQLPGDPRILYTHRPDNPGFGKGHNLAMRQVIGLSSYHLVLNPDVYFDPAILTGLLDFMDAHPEVGMVGPKVTFPDGKLQPLCKLLPTPLDVAMRRLLPTSDWVERRNRRYELHGLAYDRISSIPSLSGCFMLIRTTILEKVGLFDERFFLYFEDTDLSRRIAVFAEALFLPQFKICHHYGKASYHSFRLLKVHIKSAIRYFNKWGWVLDEERRRLNTKTLRQFETGGDMPIPPLKSRQ